MAATPSSLRPKASEDVLSAAYREHFEAVSHFVNRHTDDLELAREVAHDVFVDLWRALPQLDLSRPLLPWLHAVARRRALDEFRRRQSRARLVANLQPLAQCVEPGISRGALGLLDGLAGLDRLIVYRRVFLRDSFGEIARDLGVSCGSCRMRYSRAVAALREAGDERA